MPKKYFKIILIIISVLIIISFFFIKKDIITDEFDNSYPETLSVSSMSSKKCIDSDGMDKLTKGMVISGGKKYVDSCISINSRTLFFKNGDLVVEQYCKTDSLRASSSTYCGPAIKCRDGACIPLNKTDILINQTNTTQPRDTLINQTKICYKCDGANLIKEIVTTCSTSFSTIKPECTVSPCAYEVCGNGNCSKICGETEASCKIDCSIYCNELECVKKKYDSYFKNEPKVYNKLNRTSLDFDKLNTYLLREELRDTPYTDYSKYQQFAHSIFIDANLLVPWRLRDYSDSDLDIIFSSYPPKSSWYYRINPPSPYAYMCDTQKTFSFTSQLISSNQKNTIYNIVKSMKKYRHRSATDIGGSGCVDQILPLNIIYGCHSSSQMIAAMAINLNIPSYYFYNNDQKNLFIIGHGSVVFPNIGYISHGDSVYGTLDSTNVPTNELIIPWDILTTKIIPLQKSINYTLASGRNPEEEKYMLNLYKKYPPTSSYECYRKCLTKSNALEDGYSSYDQVFRIKDYNSSWNCIKICWGGGY